MASKKLSQRIHAKRRALERFDLTLNRHELADAVKKIQNHVNCVFIERSSNRASVFLIEIKDKWCRVVYDKQRKTIVTFLPFAGLSFVIPGLVR